MPLSATLVFADNGPNNGPNASMKLRIEELTESARIAEKMAAFGKPLDKLSKEFLLEVGLDYVRVVGCLKWLWFQWLLNGDGSLIRRRVEEFVGEEMERARFSPRFEDRSRHNLLLLHCAMFASSRAQLLQLADQVIDASGFKGHKPRNNGDVYTSAWCGTFKHWILGNHKKAAEQAGHIWGAYRPPWLKAASKPLTTPWLKRDWAGFAKAQKGDFDRLWSSARKNGTIREQRAGVTIVTVDSYPVEQVWCWAHCGMAMLAHREGVNVITDEFWFPQHALTCVASEKAK